MKNSFGIPFRNWDFNFIAWKITPTNDLINRLTSTGIQLLYLHSSKLLIRFNRGLFTKYYYQVCYYQH